MSSLNACMPVSNPQQVFWVKWVVFILRLMSRKVSWCAVRAEDKSWVEAEWLTDSSCMQRWVASAGFTLLAFACLQLAWCSCQPVIDEYHHLKCKRKRLSEGRHDEVPPAGALRDTLGTSSSLSLFPIPLLFSASLPPVCPSLPVSCFFLSILFFFSFKHLPCCLLFFSVPPTFVLLHHLPVSLLPPWFPLLISLFYPDLFNWLFVSLTCVWLRLSFSYLTLLYLSCPLYVCLLSPQKQPLCNSVYNPCCLTPLRSYEMSKFI